MIKHLLDKASLLPLDEFTLSFLIPAYFKAIYRSSFAGKHSSVWGVPLSATTLCDLAENTVHHHRCLPSETDRLTENRLASYWQGGA